MSSIAERFEAAVRALVGDGPIKQRLAHAYSAHLAGVECGQLPAGLRDDFRALQAALERIPPFGQQTPVRASVQKMSFDEAGAHAGAIVMLYRELLRGVSRAEPLKIVDRGPDDLPRYIVARN